MGNSPLSSARLSEIRVWIDDFCPNSDDEAFVHAAVSDLLREREEREARIGELERQNAAKQRRIDALARLATIGDTVSIYDNMGGGIGFSIYVGRDDSDPAVGRTLDAALDVVADDLERMSALVASLSPQHTGGTSNG